MSSRAHPSLLSDDLSNVVTQNVDYSYFKHIDPIINQSTNMFFLKSTISLNDNIFDIFETDEKNVSLLESAKSQDYYERMDKNIPLEEREYLSIFFRADNENKLYKRIGYDILTYLGDLGGILDVVVVVGHVCTTIFASRLFQAALIG